MRIAIAVATTGRAALLSRIVPLWLEQSRPADRIVIAAASPEDVAGLDDPRLEIVIGGRGLPLQRNAALDRLQGDAEVVIFFDDDFAPAADFVEQTERVMGALPEIVVATGHVLGDGINTRGLTLEDAQAMIANPVIERRPLLKSVSHAYGCNMILRVAADPTLRFDERLPLYAWQEDRDFSRRLAAHGDVVRISACRGVHLGIKAGRQSGVRFGYSQIANPVYLMGKHTMTPAEALALAGKNVAMNLARYFFPEEWVDRRGRLKGNLLAFADAMRGRMRPERILEL